MMDSYSYTEEIETIGHQSVRLQWTAKWDPKTRVHPFRSLERLIKNNSESTGGFYARIQVNSATGASIEFSSSNNYDGNLMMMVEHWTKHRFWTIPLQDDLIWDFSVTNGDTLQQQAFVSPPDGAAAFSADALQQTLTSLSICGPQFFGMTATQLSKLLVEGTTHQKQVFWNINATLDSQHEFAFGLEYSATTIDLSSFSPESSCPYGNRTLTHRQQQPKDVYVATTTLPTVYQVLRRTLPNSGRLEVHIENLSSCSSSWELRQVLPPIFVPQWKSLTLNNFVDGNEHKDGIHPRVEWRDDGTSTIFLSSSLNHHLVDAMVLSLEYKPAFLTIDDFPGDPNRGRMIPPAVLQCHHQGNAKILSNSLLLLPPVPDLSMPFNVISLTSSMYAYIVGALITLMVRKASESIRYKLHPDEKPKSKLRKLKDRILSKFQKPKPEAGEARDERRDPPSSSAAEAAIQEVKEMETKS